MNSLELKRICEIDFKYKQILYGVYPVDKIPDHLSYPCYLIINSDEHHLPGTHWVGIYFDAQKKAIFLDSFAFKPEFYGLKDYIEKMSKSYFSLKTSLQHNDSNVCGVYQLFFLFYIANNLDTTRIVSSFSLEDSKYNDNLVSYLVLKHIKERRDMM